VTTAEGTGTIKDDGTGSGGSDNDTPTVSVADTAVPEGSDARFRASLSNASTQTVSFTPTLASGTAIVGTDTAPASSLKSSTDEGTTWTDVKDGSVSLPAATPSVQLKIGTTSDNLAEPNETFTLA